MAISKQLRRLLGIALGDTPQGNILADAIDGKGPPVEIDHNGSQVVPSASKLNFTGAVTVTPSPDNTEATINVTSSGGGGASGVISSTFGQASSVPSGSPTTISSYTAVANDYLQRIEVSGDNLSIYTVLLNGFPIDKKRDSWVGSSFNQSFNWTGYPGLGLPLNPGDVVSVQVTHNSPSLSSYNARIQTVNGS